MTEEKQKAPTAIFQDSTSENTSASLVPHGCILCAEINKGFEYVNEDLDLKVCTCSKRGKVLDIQEAFDYIKHLQRELDEDEAHQTAELEEDLEELDFSEDVWVEEDWIDE